MTETRARLVTPLLVASCVILLVELRHPGDLRRLPDPDRRGVRLAARRLLDGDRDPEPRLGDRPADLRRDRRALRRPPGDRARRALYAAGLVLSANAVTPGAHQLLNILIGFGIAGTGFGVILAIVGRAASPERRSLTLGIATAAGSAGQVVGPPIAEALLGVMPWNSVFLVFAAVILAIARRCCR